MDTYRHEKPLILLSGKARSGKNTVAYILTKWFGFEQRSFAGLLKIYSEKYFGIPRHELFDNKTAHSRRIMQGLGNIFRGEVDPLYWVRKVQHELPSLSMFPVVITDARFVNELRWGREVGASLWKVVRADQPDIEYGATDPSETEMEMWSDWDAVIHNPDSPTDWWSQVYTQVVEEYHKLINPKTKEDANV